MKKIKDKHRFGIGVILTLLAFTCMMIVLLGQGNARFVISACLLLALAVVNYYYAFQKKGLVEEIVGAVDERDSYIAMKSCQRMVQIVNYILLGVTQVSLVLYGALQVEALLIVAVTLCGVLVLMFVVMMVVSGELERRG